MDVIETDKHYIFDANERFISSDVTKMIEAVVKKISLNKTLTLNMQKVENCGNEFLNMLVDISDKRKLTLVNTASEVLVLLNLSGVDKLLEIYQSDIDLDETKRRLINRKFVIV